MKKLNRKILSSRFNFFYERLHNQNQAISVIKKMQDAVNLFVLQWFSIANAINHALFVFL